MRALATWCVRHRRAVVVIWLVVLIGTVAVGRAVGTEYSNDFALPGTPSTHAYDLIKSVSPTSAGDSEQIVFATSGHATVTDPAVERTILSTLSRVGNLSIVASVAGQPEIVSPVSGDGFSVNPAQIGRHQQVAYATVTFRLTGFHVTQPEASHFVAVATRDSGHGLTIAVEGQIAEQANKMSVGGTGIGAIAALLVLLLVFGSLFAALMPLASALVALGSAIAVIGMVSHVFKMPVFAPTLAALIGLGVGIDYALFIVSRHRQGLLEGKDNPTSIVQAVNTSGRAVLFAGIIVCVALLGMFALGVSFLYGIAVSASIGVAFTMAAALTLLPAMLGFVGPKILSRGQKRTLAAGPRSPDHAGRSFWDRWSRFIDRRPVVPALIAVAIVGMLASPFFSIRLGQSDAGNDAVGTTTRTAYDLLARGFGPGYNGPLLVVARLDGSTTEEAHFQAVVTALSADPGVARVSPAVVIHQRRDGQPTSAEVALVNVIPTTAPEAAATTTLIDRLRATVIPKALGASHLTVLVGGTTATIIDFSNVLSTKLPLFIGVVVLVSFLLLAVVFRSLMVPAISAVMNLLSIGAAFGVVTAVFQWGWIATLIGVNKPGPIDAFLPVMMFAILFGLSMDYQVFLVTRMHEEWLRSGDNRTAVRLGLARTGKTITTAAAIMIVVFASFILGGQRVIKEFGLGLSGGVLVDALVIRMAIVPAVMFLFGRSNWWFPRALDRVLPKIGLEHD